MGLSGAERQARYRAKNKARLNAKRRKARAVARASAPVSVPVVSADPAGELARWSADVLKVPAGHKLAGQPMDTCRSLRVDWLRDALAPGVREAGLFIGRKNAKSAICAVYLLGRLVGPLRMDGYRAGIASVDKIKAGSCCKQQMEDIATASGLEGLRFLRSPAPGQGGNRKPARSTS